MKKLRENKGFTLLEMLACVVTLLLLSGIVSAGSNLAMKSYNESLFESNSQMLESSLNLYLTDIFRHSRIDEVNGLEEVNWDDEFWAGINVDNLTDKEDFKTVKTLTNVEYQIYDGSIKTYDKNTQDEDNRTFLVYETKRNPGIMLVEEGMYATTLYISDFVVLYNTEKHYFTGYYTIKSTILDNVHRNCSFSCGTIKVEY